MGIVNTFATGFSVPAGLAVDTSQNIYVAEAATGKVWRFTAVSSLPSINSGGVVNAASYAAPVAAGSIAAAYGNFLLSLPSTTSILPLPTNVSGLSMQFGGFGSPGVPVPLFYASGGQVNLQVPWELAGQAQTPLTVSLSSQTSAPQVMNLAPFAPGIFSINSQGTGQGAILDASYHLVDVSNPATAGTTYIQIYCTGLGAVTNQPPSGSPAPGSPLAETTTIPTVSIGNVPAQALFYGLAPGYVGLYQVNAQVPAGAPGGAAVPVTISIGGVTSNTVTIAVE
jgi:minor extracellular serine protease Vpr